MSTDNLDEVIDAEFSSPAQVSTPEKAESQNDADSKNHYKSESARKTTTFCVRLNKDVADAVKNRASNENMTQSMWIRLAIENALTRGPSSFIERDAIMRVLDDDEVKDKLLHVLKETVE